MTVPPDPAPSSDPGRPLARRSLFRRTAGAVFGAAGASAARAATPDTDLERYAIEYKMPPELSQDGPLWETGYMIADLQFWLRERAQQHRELYQQLAEMMASDIFGGVKRLLCRYLQVVKKGQYAIALVPGLDPGASEVETRRAIVTAIDRLLDLDPRNTPCRSLRRHLEEFRNDRRETDPEVLAGLGRLTQRLAALGW